MLQSLMILITLGLSLQDRPGVSALIEQLGGTDSKQRLSAVLALAELGPGAKDAVPALVRALRDQQIQSAASYALGKIGPAAAPAVVRELRNRGSDKAQLNIVLSGIGPDAVPALSEAFRDRDPEVRLTARMVVEDFLRRSKPEAKDAVARDAIPALISALGDTDPGVRADAATISGKLEARAKDAVPALMRALGDPSPNVQTSAGIALEGIGPDAVRPLTRALGDPSSELRRQQAAFVLGKVLTKVGRSAHPLFLEGLLDKDPNVRVQVFLFWRQWPIPTFAPGDDFVVPLLIRGLRDADPGLRQFAVLALVSRADSLSNAVTITDGINQSAASPLESAVPALREALQDKDPKIRAEAARALKIISQKQRP